MSTRVGVSEENKDQAIQEIEELMNATKDLRMRERYQTILMILNGEKFSKISRYTGRNVSSLYNYAKYYRENGVEGLVRKSPPGLKRKLSPEQEAELKQTLINKTPEEVGFPAEMNWTSPLVRKWMKNKFGIQYSDRGTREVLYRLGFSFTKPTYTLEKADPKRQEEFKEEF